MGRLIIAEKHSVAQAIAAALGGGKAEDGWIGCGADAVTWAQGHLVDLLTPDEYQDRGWDKWSMDALPLDPTGGWKWKVNRQRGADRQYRVVAGLLKSDAYDVLVNACDPDREGETIFRRIVSYARLAQAGTAAVGREPGGGRHPRRVAFDEERGPNTRGWPRPPRSARRPTG